VSETLRETIATAHDSGVSARTLNRLAVLLAARQPDDVVKLEDLGDALAAELGRRIRQARAAHWSDEALREMVEQALRSERHQTAAQRRVAFCEHLDRVAADAFVASTGAAAA
jgi:hypothetical protein